MRIAGAHGSAVVLSLLVAACGGNDDSTPYRPFGDSAVVTVVNPIVNTANPVAGPATGDARSGIVVDANPGGVATTDVTGLARVAPLPASTTELVIGAATPLPRKASLLDNAGVDPIPLPAGVCP